MARVRLSSFFSESPCFAFSLSLLWFLGQLLCCSAGQIITDGLSIINSPQPGNPAHVGNPISISVEVSGNGKLPLEATNTNSSSATHYDSLEIYLISSQTGKNYTVASGSEFLNDGTGSVRQCNWKVPACVPEGQYNLTFYERSHINGQPHFIITSILSPVENSQGLNNEECTELSNDYLGQPQDSSPPSPPFYQDDWGSTSRTSGMTTSYTGNGTGPTGPVLITITLSASGGLPFPFPPTVTVTVPSISVSQVVSLTTVTSVQGPSTTTFVQTLTSLVTVTPSGNPGDLGSGRIIPINSGCITRITLVFLILPLSILWSLV
ncbi:hypothetical protein E1B28_001212 [Marasmius oreades]|uniref:Uncharacterized protein n=1 Tax=Marasmius oreades TaxID=181124 RepID=A0A9P8AEY1_9AGAR|nr:uncharacterized protein E1B28_001212 [Marasmius oreades]KAG7099356.1 hypothetical protein E1B28_001212 [Marasmius oreades]